MRLFKGVLAALFVFVGVISADTLKVIGSTTCQNVFLLPSSTGFKQENGIELQVEGIGSVKGIIALIKGEAKVSAISEAMPMAVASAQLLDPTLSVPGNLQFHEITKDKIVMIVNAKNKVNFLTPQQVTDIYTGKIKNWKELKGMNGKIRPIINRRGSGTEDTFYRALMNEQDYANTVSKTTNMNTIIRSVSKDPNAIGIASERLVKGNNKIKILKSREIARRLGLVTVGEPNENVKKLIAFLTSKEGRKYYE